MPPAKFGFYTTLGALPFSIVLVYLGELLGARWSELVPYFAYADDAIIVIVVVLAVWWLLRWYRSSRGSQGAPRVLPPS